jgi:hypothetical protein
VLHSKQSTLLPAENKQQGDTLLPAENKQQGDTLLPAEKKQQGDTLLPAENKQQSDTLFPTRVTRLGEFSPIWRLFSLGSFLENYISSANSWGTFFYETSYV